MTRRTKIAVACGTALAGVVVAFVVAHMLFAGLSWWPLGKPKTPFTSTALRLKALAFTICAYQADAGRYPQSLDELRESLKLGDSGDRRHAMFYDAWGQPFRYVRDNRKLNEEGFDLYSLGKNGEDEYCRPGFGDDIHILGSGAVRMHIEVENGTDEAESVNRSMIPAASEH